MFISEMWLQNYLFLYTLPKKGLYNFPNLEKRLTFAFGFADMAQLVEQRIRNAWVRGSSPLIGSNRFKPESEEFGACKPNEFRLNLFRFPDASIFLQDNQRDC